MSEFPRAQKIAALGLITTVVVITLAVLAVRGGQGNADAVEQVDANLPPAVTPILSQPKDTWASIASTVRGAASTTAPVACPFLDEREREPNNFLSLTPALTFVCDVPGLDARPIAPGRVVMVVNQPALNSFKADLVANDNDGPWLRAAAYGAFVVIDHGPINGVSNVTSVYAALDTIEPGLAVGQSVDNSTPLGSLSTRQINDELVNGVLTFELLTDDTRFGADPVRQAPGPVTASPGLAAEAAKTMQLPATTCSVPFGNPNLVVGAPREYSSLQLWHDRPRHFCGCRRPGDFRGQGLCRCANPRS